MGLAQKEDLFWVFYNLLLGLLLDIYVASFIVDPILQVETYPNPMTVVSRLPILVIIPYNPSQYRHHGIN